MKTTHDVLVIGGGAAGLTASAIAANLGARTLMIERERLGGDCTWTGCVPSKTLLMAAKVAHHLRHASTYGLVDHDLSFDFSRVIEHVHTIRDDVYEDADRPEIYEAMGVDVRTADARFVDAHTLELTHDGGTDRVSGRYIVIAAGAHATVPPIDGLADVPYLTNESLFEIDALPRRLAIIGGGPIGTEMAQAFQRLGSEVTVVDRAAEIMGRDDPELAGLLRGVLEQEGVQYALEANVRQVGRTDDGLGVTIAQNGQTRTLVADALLVATGRAPNLDGLDLDAAGVAYTKQGVTVDDHGRTNVRHIYAAGDVTGRYQFTHMSEHMAKVAVTNALLKLPTTFDTDHVPWTTYTDPELGHVGATEAQLEERGKRYEVYRFPYDKLDRAVTEQQTTGLIKVYATRLTGKILGADVLGTSAGELISEYAVAMRNGVTLRQIADTIHPYPSYGLGARRAADQWYYRKQSARLVKLLKFVFRYRGPVNEYEPGRIV